MTKFMNPSQNYPQIQPNQQPVVSQPQVTEQLEALITEIEDNGRLIGVLESKLVTVIPGQPPQTAGQCGGGVPEEYLVPLANKLRELYRGVRQQNIDMRRIIDAIQL